MISGQVVSFAAPCVKALDSATYYAYDAVGRMEHTDGTAMGAGTAYCGFVAVGSATTAGRCVEEALKGRPMGEEMRSLMDVLACAPKTLNDT